MKIGIPKEVKDHEYRVGATPVMVKALRKAGPEKVYTADMMIKVKEPRPIEYPLLKECQILFCYLHLAPDPKQTKALLKQQVVGIAFETVVDHKGRISIQAGANALHMASGGRGVLLSGVPGVSPGKVVIIGGGIVGTQAAKMGVGLGADVAILDNNLQRLRDLDNLFEGRLKTLCGCCFDSRQIDSKVDHKSDCEKDEAWIC